MNNSLLTIPTDQIRPDPNQPRKEFGAESIESLGEAIKSEGLLQPITVRKDPDDVSRFIIIAGERRWRAHVAANLATVRANVDESKQNESDRFRIQVIENTQRQDMTLQELAAAAVKLTELGDGEKTIATALALSVSRMKNIRKMHSLSPGVWKMLNSGSINNLIAEYVMGNVESLPVAESLLLRMRGKSRSASAVIVESYLDELAQEDFSLSFGDSEAVQNSQNTARELAVKIKSIASQISEMSSDERGVFARQIGDEIASMLPEGEQTKRGAAFIIKAMNRVNSLC